MVNHVLNLPWGHGIGILRRFDDIGAKSLNGGGQNVLQDGRGWSVRFLQEYWYETYNAV